MPNEIKPFLLTKQQKFKACIRSLQIAVNAQGFWIYANSTLLHYLLFRQAPPLSEKYSFYNQLFLDPAVDFLTYPLK